MSNILVNASIVLYHNKREQLKKVIDSFLGTQLDVLLYLVDNSADDTLKDLAALDNRIIYIFNNANLGYGAGHNVAIRKSIEMGIEYHVVLNPDLNFESSVIDSIYEYMQNHQDVGNLMPKILYPNGENQYLAKLLPTPLDWILRRFLPARFTQSITEKFELRYTGYDEVMNVPFLSGCFMFLRTKALKDVGLFDEDIFMYMEDVDLNRRIHAKYKTVYYPEAHIFHEYERGSHKNFKLLLISIGSSIKYFNKWGWFFDKERKNMNNKILKDTNYV
ncbi:glycosyltransferase family 2 protein [bacterium]|nr:glycosyltransferase family 2 protein [bacterium]MBU1435301.1 glycosyltransferase family 2 protein [bacterium]MBU1503499.1 glycosyltransferase family 2 protein [bacterium]MBU3939040.1 glycosyltransferase family 2 protein [bacterium]MBU4025613.1 glycosyltransferase family 2 protein [bacterium]